MPAGRDVGDLARRGLDLFGVDAEGGAARQNFTAELQQDALVAGHCAYCDRFELRVLAARFGRRDVADFEANEARDRDVLAELGDLGLHELVDGEGRFLDEGLLDEADLFVELADAAFHDAVENLLGLAFVAGALAGDLALFFEQVRGNVLFAEELRIGRRDVHRDVVDHFLEHFGARDEVGLAVDFHHHAKLAAGVNVAADETLPGGARRLLAGRRDAMLAQYDFGLADIALGLDERFLALHHARAGALAELFY